MYKLIIIFLLVAVVDCNQENDFRELSDVLKRAGYMIDTKDNQFDSKRFFNDGSRSDDGIMAPNIDGEEDGTIEELEPYVLTPSEELEMLGQNPDRRQINVGEKSGGGGKVRPVEDVGKVGADVAKVGGDVGKVGADIGDVEKLGEDFGKVRQGIFVEADENQDETSEEIQLGEGEEKEPEITEEEMDDDDDMNGDEGDDMDVNEKEPDVSDTMTETMQGDNPPKRDLNKDEKMLVLERLFRKLMSSKLYK